MITEAAVVKRCDGRQVELELQRGSTCAGCDLNQACGTGALGRLLGQRRKPLIIDTEHEYAPGDRLLLGLPESALVKVSLTIYGLPLLGMVVAGLLAVLASAAEILVVLIAIIGFFCGYKFATYLTQKLEQDLLVPHIIEIEVNPGTTAGS
ncbi:MAG: SoxR reducing system RseC family protein [Gammaproteobacteria bacterium]|nr:SoxR reducing system RseC family protein [Gammaproteobacteria bacterium]